MCGDGQTCRRRGATGHGDMRLGLMFGDGCRCAERHVVATATGLTATSAETWEWEGMARTDWGGRALK